MAVAFSETDPAPPARPLEVRIAGARLAYRGLTLFDGLDLALPAGQVTCLLGPSGIGKSSLLRLLAGLAPEAGGRIETGDGRPLAGRVAFMDQRDLLLPWLSVEQNLLLGSRLRGEVPDRARARALLAELGLGDRATDRPAALSGGMRQRVALARTLLEDRPLVLLDEPFAALDALTRHRLQALAARLLAGRTVLLVTHDPAEAIRLGHRLHVMSGLPARLDAPLPLPGLPPREPTSDAFVPLYRELMQRLGKAAGGVA